MRRVPRSARLLLPALVVVTAGCATTQEIVDTGHDPFEPYNRTMHAFNDLLDRVLLKPLAEGYKEITPEPVDESVSNFFANLGDVVNALNNLLQFKFEAALNDTARVVYNTTFGIGGLFDVATRFGLPKHNEDFGQTLGHWGVGEGYYLVLPVLGPSTTRDAFGLVVDYQANPVTHLEPRSHRYALRALEGIDTRADLLRAERALGEAALDPYLFMRDAYLQRRRNLVYDGDPPRPTFDPDEFDDDDDTLPPSLRGRL